MNWAFYSPLSCPLEELAAAGGGRREEGPGADRRLGGEWGGEAGGPEEQAGHPRPAREAGPAEPWAARPRPAVAMEPGRGRGPGRSARAGLVARGSTGTAGEAASLAQRRLRLRGCSVPRGRAWRKPPECPGTFVCPLCRLDRSSKGRPGAFWPPWFAPFCTDLATGGGQGVRCSLFAGGDLPHFAGEDLMHVGSFVCSELESQGSSEPPSPEYGVSMLSS